ncbi:MAG: glutamine--fructose-6-phosphate transaminase (isomerizing) [Candidatus Omnitrophica bacterium]|nr:glutamine--fructose-6-phosphate transaminase (isomerizing) [Candidatus Omnitrophota bacterium]MBU1997742.1 glutamine--fructose-6-phosphate transaminase (isomerizing) [Candidatus Omnitrophota bacterium]MBU4334243.1 glutamine--fructose-6-phosphate transaminase (isomerizing) [Candidatus Omnitrophota bacterium]
MCGIIGYIGSKQATPILLDGLKKLEYRGYDSSGIGIVCSVNHKLVLRKMHGKIQNLEKLIKDKPIGQSSVGISHTRWATHGAPNKVNAHPHFDCSKKILVVHNGIIENYEELKRTLIQKGHKFVSQTDTEVISHLIEQHYKGDIFEAVKKAIRHLRGAFALGVICKDEPEKLIAARIGSPLIVGIGNGENFIASDVPAILDKTKKIIYLKDGEIASITKQEVLVHTFAGMKVKPKVNIVKFDVDSVKKQGYAHFMLKEIHEQPAVLSKIIKDRIKGNRISLEGLNLTEKQLKAFKNIFIVACGTAYHAGMVGKYAIEKLASIPVSIDAASEFRYRDPIIDKKTLIIAISQSGETADTLAAVREARSKGAKVVSICNVVGSSLARESDGILYTHAGPEIGVASTKAYIAQIAMLYLLALKLSIHTNKISEKTRHVIIKDLKRVPSLYKDILKTKSFISKIAKKNSHFGCFLFLGRNINYPSALEGALKLKEISYIPAEGYAAGEMKHGPIALIDEYRAVVCIAVQSATYEKMISNIQEIRARKGKIIAIATQGDQTIKKHSNHVIYVPKTTDLLTPLLVALPLQLFAYYVSVGLGCDVDQPRNLAKSVTVE